MPRTYSTKQEESSHRSRNRAAIVLATDKLGAATIGQLQRATGIDRARIRWAIYGHPPQFSKDRSIIATGSLVRVRAGRSKPFVITRAGRAEAARLRDEMREALRRAVTA